MTIKEIQEYIEEISYGRDWEKKGIEEKIDFISRVLLDILWEMKRDKKD